MVQVDDISDVCDVHELHYLCLLSYWFHSNKMFLSTVPQSSITSARKMNLSDDEINIMMNEYFP